MQSKNEPARYLFDSLCFVRLGRYTRKVLCQDPLAKAVFQREATNAWQTYLARARHFQATWTESLDLGKGITGLGQIRHEVQHATDRALFLSKILYEQES